MISQFWFDFFLFFQNSSVINYIILVCKNILFVLFNPAYARVVIILKSAILSHKCNKSLLIIVLIINWLDIYNITRTRNNWWIKVHRIIRKPLIRIVSVHDCPLFYLNLYTYTYSIHIDTYSRLVRLHLQVYYYYQYD